MNAKLRTAIGIPRQEVSKRLACGRLVPAPFAELCLRNSADYRTPDLYLDKEIIMAVATQIREHIEVISSDGQHARYADHIEGARIKMAKGLIVLAMLVALSALGWASPVLAQTQTPRSSQPGLPSPSDDLLKKLEGVYKDIHANPELSMQEQRTAGIAADWLRQNAYEVTNEIGGTGVVGLLRNGDGPTVLMRADMDGLPMKENTGLAYASKKVVKEKSGQEVPVAHSCGHDMHVTWLMGATQILAANKDKWRGTVMAVFQPGEETGEGAKAMVDDGLTKRFPKPTVALAQHVLPLATGQTGIRSGLFLSQSDSLRVTLFGSGGHGSSPETTVDPVVMAAATVMRLQTVVSREIGMTDNAVVSVGSVQAGYSANIIPNEAVLQLNIRTFNDQVRERVLSSIKRIVNGEATTSGAPKPPEITKLPGEFPLTVNDEDATRKVTEALRQRLGPERVGPTGVTSASEDFTVISRAWNTPSVYWAVGGVDPQQYAEAEKAGRLNEIPSNHSPEFAPVISPTLQVGIEAMLAAAGAWLTPAGAKP
jgi:amidohydrolase